MKYIHTPTIALTCTLIALLSSCSRNPAPAQPQTRVGQIATYGRTFLLSVEEAQKGVVELNTAGTVPREDAVKAMEVFKQIGEAGQSLASALKLAGTAAGTPGQTSSFTDVQNILNTIANLLDSALVPIGDQSARSAIAKLIQGVNKALIEVSIQLTKS